MPADPALLMGLAAVFGGTAIVYVAAVVLPGSRADVDRSVTAISTMSGGAMAAPAATDSFGDRVLAPAYSRLGRWARACSPAGAQAKLERLLDLAGNPRDWTADRVFGFKGVATLLLGGLGALWAAGSGWFLPVTAVAVLAGFYLPDLLLYNAGTKRQDEIRKMLPDALDLLTISVEAGLGFDAAMGQVARNTQGPLAGEFFRVLQEMQIGKSRSEAFQGLGERTTVPELRTFVTAISQADALGIPIANVLREQSKEMRVKRRQRAEEKAQKVPVKILFPLVFFILPALFVVILGPGAIGIYDALVKQ